MPDRDAMIEAAAIIAADANRMVNAQKTAERVLDVPSERKPNAR